MGVELLNLARMTVASAPGTGANVVLGVAVPGFLSFDLAGAVDGRTYRYGIRDGANREVSQGVYTAATKTLSRTVIKSTNGGAPIDASASATVASVVAAEDVTARRELLTANRSYYVATAAGGGSDSNDGLTVGTPFATINKAINVATSLDPGIFGVQINVADGTYAAGIALKPAISGSMAIIGNNATPGNVVINATGAFALIASNAGNWTISGMRLRAISAGFSCIFATGAVSLNLSKFELGRCGNTHITATGGARVSVSGAYSILEGCNIHTFASFGGQITIAGQTITLNNPTVTMANGTPGIVTDTAHGMLADTPVAYSTTGNLRTPLSPGVIYYVRNPTADTYELAATIGGASIALSGTEAGTQKRLPAFSQAFAYCETVSVQQLNANTYVGAAGGIRYSVLTNAVINVTGAGANYLPGSAAGSTDGNGIYV